MAGLNPKTVAGRHLILFETYYLALDPTSKGSISAADAANFLKRSQLSDTILSKIWDLSDTAGKGALDKLGFFTSLKLVALAQNGREVTPAGLLDDVPEPEMDAKAARKPPVEAAKPPGIPPQPAKAPAMDWMPKQNEFVKYKQMYLSREPENGIVAGAKAKSLLMESQLPVDKLGKIWDLADQDKDGALNEAEFTVAMHLVCKCMELNMIPDVLPPELQKLIALGSAAAKPPMPVAVPAPVAIAAPMQATQLVTSAAKPIQKDNWVVPLEDRAKYRNLFESCDKDRDGYVSGAEIKDVFLQSGLPQNTLAHIWNLCDTDQSGKLSTEQFALAMWFVKNALVGIAPPDALTPEMLGPSMQPVVAAAIPQKPPEPVETNPEFALIIKEINELSTERINIEDEIASKDSEKKIKTGEIKSLQSELDTLSATLKQLETQKSVAVGKLAELESQVSTLREQAEEQETTLVAQELELSTKAAELQGLDQEEHDIMTSLEQYGRDIEKLGTMLQDALLQISQNKTRVTSLTDLKVGMEESVTKFAAAIESTNVYTVTEPELRDLKPELDELLEGIEGTPQYLNGEASQANGFESAFEPSFPETSKPWGDTGFGPSGGAADPFAPKDPFAPHDPFAPAAGGGRQDFSPGKDPFGAEPFAEEEAAPALPPKRPPPRPAPPKNAPARPPPPSMGRPPSKPDPFASQEPADGGFAEFADFANFDNQQPWGSSSSFSSNSINNHSHQQPQQRRGHGQPQLEFTEDPFKNYRYEDPFAHSDPFAG